MTLQVSGCTEMARAIACRFRSSLLPEICEPSPLKQRTQNKHSRYSNKHTVPVHKIRIKTPVEVCTCTTENTQSRDVTHTIAIPVVLLLDEVIARAEGDEMRVVGRRRDGDATRAAHVGVTQLIRQHLQLVGVEVIVVPQHVVVRRTRRALDAGVAAQVEVELGGVSDADVDRRARRDVAALANLKQVSIHFNETSRMHHRWDSPTPAQMA